MTYQRTLYTFHRPEAWLWAAVGLIGAWAVQILGCLDAGDPCTWQRLVLSSVCGPILGLIVWLLQFPLRWWFLVAAVYAYVTGHWETITGAPYPYHLPEQHHPLWLAAGVLGTFLYTRWLAWKYEDYGEQLTIYLCFWGSFLGAPALLLGTWGILKWRREKREQAAALEAANRFVWQEALGRG